MGGDNPQVYYSKETLEVLRQEFDRISPETWHLIFNPYCVKCLESRGEALLDKWKIQNQDPSGWTTTPNM